MILLPQPPREAGEQWQYRDFEGDEWISHPGAGTVSVLSH